MQGINILHDMGLSVSHQSINNKKDDLVKQQEELVQQLVKSFVTQACEDYQSKKDASHQSNPGVVLDNESESKVQQIEVLGDNLDIMIAPSKMTMDRQRRSLHWFLIMVKNKRVTYDDVHVASGTVPDQPHVNDIPSFTWIPSEEQANGLHRNFVFHVSKVLIRYIKFLEEFEEFYPEFIPHEYIELTKKKSIVYNCDLIEASENSSQGMINILQKIHEIAVPHTDNSVARRVVFGGDVLTNERAFSAQEAMQNNESTYSNLMGVIHRPEGLHRQFNFLLVK
jgi:hypothetical protein